MKHKREERALEALFVSQLRPAKDADAILDRLPELTSGEKAALDSLGSDFIDRVIEGESS